MLYQNRFYQTTVLSESPKGWSGIVVRELGQIISMYVIKNWTTSKHFFNIGQWYIIYKRICNKHMFAEIIASNENMLCWSSRRFSKGDPELSMTRNCPVYCRCFHKVKRFSETFWENILEPLFQQFYKMNVI